MTFNEQIENPAVMELLKVWGGRLPNWEEYKKAYRDGRVRGNKTVAAQAIYLEGIPKPYLIIYGIITLWLGFLMFPITAIAWFFLDFSAWWILGSFFAAWLLVKISREGHCEGMKHGAEINEELYEALVNNGAFLFLPDREMNI
jgi:hypothetical protein